MERDARRDRGEWRGCHSFDKIVCDGNLPAVSERRGGLKMGQTYYYYYEVDGSTETYNPSLPTTTVCPFLPGQTVNTLEVPSERRLRMKSASMNSLRNTDYKTMDPIDRFTTPRPQPPPAYAHQEFRTASASPILPKRATRSVSPAPSWTGTARRFFGFRPHHRDTERGRKSALSEADNLSIDERDPPSETRCTTPSGSIRSRDLSPESLRRFLSDDVSCSPLATEPAPVLSIPDDIAEENEENDDDDNFATSAVSENTSFTTLSPPPFQQGLTAPPASHTKCATIIASKAPVADAEAGISLEQHSSIAPFQLDILRSRSNTSAVSSGLASPASPLSNISRGLSQLSFFDDSDDEEGPVPYEDDRAMVTDTNQNQHIDNDMSKLEREAPITSYSLPQAPTEKEKHLNTSHILPPLESPALVARNDNGVPVGTSSLFSLPNVDIGLDDLVSDMSWMADVIRQKAL